MFIQADLLILILASIISFTLQSPCKILVQCSCKGTGNNTRAICMEDDIVDEPCSRWPGCVVCRKGKECQKCSGDPSCTEATTHKGKVRQKRQNYMRPWNPVSSRYQGPCPEMEPSMGVSSVCYSPPRERCIGRCIPGHRFENRESETEIELTCQNGAWTPLRRFPDCKSDGSCELEVIGSGRFNCTSDDNGTHCEVTCSRQYAGQFHCFPGRGWNPPLPRCVSQIGSPTTGSSGNTRQPCRCQNGAQCDRNGRCNCREGRRGEFCEIVSPEREACNDPGFILNGYRRNANGQDSNSRSSFQDGDSVVYSCSQGFGLQGSPVLSCRARSWSATKPWCSRRPGSSSPTDSFGITRPSCRCQNNGQCDRNGRCICPAGWRGEFCEIGVEDRPIVMCPDPGQVAAAERLNADGSRSVNYQQYQVGQSVAYTCNDGFALQGRSLITCRGSGTWSAGLPTCIDSECLLPRSPPESPPNLSPSANCYNPFSIDNGQTVYWPAPSEERMGPMPVPEEEQFPEGARLQYACDEGYTLNGAETLTCDNNGFWSDRLPSCDSNG